MLILFIDMLILAFGISTASATVNKFYEVAHASNYVIITTNDIVANSDELENFIRLKEAFGYSVRVVTETDFDELTGQAPNGRAEKIRQWLIDNQELGIQYVLLIGNPDPDDPTDPSDSVGDIPMKMCWPRFEEWLYREYPTDFFYADLDGNWDLDGDLYYGEWMSIDAPTKPDELSEDDTFSIRWTGKINIEDQGMYSFATFSDDGARLWIDGELIIDDWVSHPPRFYASECVNFTTTGLHDIQLDFHQHTVDAIICLLWCGPGFGYETPWLSELYYYDNETGTFKLGGLNAAYYENEDFTALKLSKIERHIIDFYWLTGDRGLGGVDFDAEVYVGRIPVYDNDFAQLDHILQKMINYETEQGDRSWRKKILLASYPLNPVNPGWDILESIKKDIADPNGFISYRIFNSSYGTPPPPCEMTTCTPEIVENEWKKGYGMVIWHTHGSATGASHVFSTPRCLNLDDTKPSFIFQASCNNAYPEDENNLAYSLLKHGAVCTVGATRVAYGEYETLAYNYTKNLIQGKNTAGEALFRAKNLSTPVADQSWFDWCNLLALNIYGDPACFLFIPLLTDLNKDGTVNIQDLFIVAKAWQTKPGDENWDPRADLDGNDLINIVDLYEVAKDYQKTA